MSSPLVSVIIPTYNYEAYVAKAVHSALEQSYSSHEVIVVDDGSTDQTRDRLQPFMKRITYLHQENQGLSAARNAGIRAAKGEFVALLDSDDAFHPRKIELQMKVLRQNPEAALIGSQMFSDPQMQWPDIPDGQLPVREISLKSMAIKPRFAPSSVLVRRVAFESVGLFDTSLPCVEDRDMWLRIGTRFFMLRLELPLTWYRQTPGSMSRAPEKMERFELQVLKKALKQPELRFQFLAHQQALSHCYRSSAYTFHEAGKHGCAFRKVLRSLVLWPWFYSRFDEVPFLYRTRLLRAIVRDWNIQRKMRKSAVSQPAAGVATQ